MLTRRECLKTVGAAALAAGTFGAAQEDLRATARKNLKMAIFTGIYSRLPVQAAASRIKKEGFVGVVLQPDFADAHFDWSKPDWNVAKKITDAFETAGIAIVGLFGYYNIVDPNAGKRRVGEARMAFLIENWKRLGSPIISTETGTLNPKSEWLESPENTTEKGYTACRDALAKLVKAAEKTGATIAIEPYWRNIIDSVERTERLFRDIPSPSLKLVMDPCNYFRKEDLPKMQAMLKEIFERVGKQTVIAHAKDVKAAPEGTDLPAAGKGVLDYPLYLRLLASMDKEVYLAVEHLTIDDVLRARDYVLDQFDKI